MLSSPWYDPLKTYEQNYDDGPTGEFGDGLISDNSTETKYTFFGKPLRFPLGIPAGPLLNGKYVKAALEKGFDIPVYKTVRTRAHGCLPWPNVLSVKVEGDLMPEKTKSQLVATTNYTEPLSITNSFGVPSKDPSVWQPDMAASVAYARPGQHVVGSYQGTKWDGYSSDDYLEDWVVGAKLVTETGVSAIEANLSCPNEGTTALLCFDAPKVARIVSMIKDAVGDVPLIVKIAYFEEQALRDFVAQVGPIVDGIAAINTISAEVINEKGEQALPGEKRLRSGVCGASITWAGLDMTARLKALRDELKLSYTIVGVGGVMNPDDFYVYQSKGADFVMTATGAMWNPGLARAIKTAR